MCEFAKSRFQATFPIMVRKTTVTVVRLPGGQLLIISPDRIHVHTPYPHPNSIKQIQDKIDVNGKNESPVYTFLKEKKGGLLGKDIKCTYHHIVARDDDG